MADNEENEEERCDYFCGVCEIHFDKEEACQAHMKGLSHYRKVKEKQEKSGQSAIKEEKIDPSKKMFNCEICDVTCTGEINFQQHLNSAKHIKVTNRVERRDDLEAIRRAVKDVDSVATDEAVFYDIVGQPLIDECMEPLIGIDYVTEYRKDYLQLSRDYEQVYRCDLCNLRLYQTQLTEHLTGYKHRTLYMKFHHEEKHATIWEMKSTNEERNKKAKELATEIENVEGRYSLRLKLEFHPMIEPPDNDEIEDPMQFEGDWEEVPVKGARPKSELIGIQADKLQETIKKVIEKKQQVKARIEAQRKASLEQKAKIKEAAAARGARGVRRPNSGRVSRGTPSYRGRAGFRGIPPLLRGVWGRGPPGLRTMRGRPGAFPRNIPAARGRMPLSQARPHPYEMQTVGNDSYDEPYFQGTGESNFEIEDEMPYKYEEPNQQGGVQSLLMNMACGDGAPTRGRGRGASINRGNFRGNFARGGGDNFNRGRGRAHPYNAPAAASFNARGTLTHETGSRGNFRGRSFHPRGRGGSNAFEPHATQPVSIKEEDDWDFEFEEVDIGRGKRISNHNELDISAEYYQTDYTTDSAEQFDDESLGRGRGFHSSPRGGARSSPGLQQIAQIGRGRGASYDDPNMLAEEFGDAEEEKQYLNEVYDDLDPDVDGTVGGGEEATGNVTAPTGNSKELFDALAESMLESESDAQFAFEISSVLAESLKKYTSKKKADPSKIAQIEENLNQLQALQDGELPTAPTPQRFPPHRGGCGFPPVRGEPSARGARGPSSSLRPRAPAPQRFIVPKAPVPLRGTPPNLRTHGVRPPRGGQRGASTATPFARPQQVAHPKIKSLMDIDFSEAVAVSSEAEETMEESFDAFSHRDYGKRQHESFEDFNTPHKRLRFASVLDRGRYRWVRGDKRGAGQRGRGVDQNNRGRGQPVMDRPVGRGQFHGDGGRGQSGLNRGEGRGNRGRARGSRGNNRGAPPQHSNNNARGGTIPRGTGPRQQGSFSGDARTGYNPPSMPLPEGYTGLTHGSSPGYGQINSGQEPSTMAASTTVSPPHVKQEQSGPWPYQNGPWSAPPPSTAARGQWPSGYPPSSNPWWSSSGGSSTQTSSTYTTANNQLGWSQTSTSSPQDDWSQYYEQMQRSDPEGYARWYEQYYGASSQGSSASVQGAPPLDSSSSSEVPVNPPLPESRPEQPPLPAEPPPSLPPPPPEFEFPKKNKHKFNIKFKH